MKYLNIRKNEYIPVIYGFIYSFLIVSFFILSKSFRDALFLNTFGKEELSFIYLINPIISGFFVWIFIYFLKNKSLLYKSILIHISTLIISLLLLLNLNESLVFIYYIFVDFQISIIALLFWQVLSGCFTNRQAKRLFGIITSGGFLSALILGSSLSYITQYMPQKEFLIFYNILILLCPIFSYKLINNSFNESNNNPLNKSQNTFSYLLKNRYILNIVFITFLFTIISVFIDYNFKILSYSNYLNDPDALVNYFTKFYSIASFISFLIQIFISGYIINKYGIKYSLIILPFFLLLLLPFGFYLVPFLIVSLLKGQEQIFKPTLHDTSMQILWMPIPNYKKIVVKPLVNILLKNIFSTVAALLLIGSVYLELDFIYFIPVMILLLVLLIYLLTKTRVHYINELIKAIDDRSLSFEDKDIININDDVEFLKIIGNKLKTERKNRYFILSLLDKDIINKTKNILIEIFQDSDLKTQKFLLKHFKNDEKFIDSKFLVNQIKNNNSISLISLKLLAKRSKNKVNNINIDLTNSDDKHIKYSAINNCIHYNYSNKNNLIQYIHNNISNNTDSEYIIKYLDPNYIQFSPKNIIRIFPYLNLKIFLDALKFINSTNINTSILDMIINKVHRNYFIDKRLLILFNKIDKTILFKYFESNILDKNYLIAKKIFINDIMIQIDQLRLVKLYEKLLLQLSYDIKYYKKIIDSLIFIKRKNIDYCIKNNSIDSLISNLTDSLYLDIRMTYLIKNDHLNRKLILEYFNENINCKSKLLFKIIFYNNKNLFKNSLNFSSLDNKLYLNKIIEIYEEYINEAQKSKIIPILDDIAINEKNTLSLKYYKSFKKIDIKYLFSENLRGKDEWYDFIILPELFKIDTSLRSFDHLRNNSYFKLVFNHLDLNEDNLFKKENINLILSTMITILEKTLYLKDSSIFKDIPAKELIYIAQSLIEVNLLKGSSVFKDGDLGDSMYFIFNGKVQISKGGTELITLNKADYFGEMALLDGEARSADAIAIDDTILLKLDARDFKKILYSNDKIVKGILGMLSSRLRKANELLNKK